MMQVSVPIYQSELSPAKQRGLMVGSHGIFIVCGYAMAAWTGLGCYFAEPTVQWRLCLSLQLVAPLALLIGSPWLPESPRFLIGHGREQQGLEVLQRLHVRADDKGDTNHIAAKEEFYQIRKQLELEKQTGVQSFMEMLKRPSYRKRIYCGVLVQFAAQSTGVLVVNNYQILLYHNLGLQNWLPLLLYGIYTSWAAFLNWINALLLDRVGPQACHHHWPKWMHLHDLHLHCHGCGILLAPPTRLATRWVSIFRSNDDVDRCKG